MQYYRKLTAHMGLIADKICVSFLRARILLVMDKLFIQSHHIPGVCKQEIILIRMADHLLSGNTNLFYEMLEILQDCGVPIIHRLILEILVALSSTGSYIHKCIVHITGLNLKCNKM